MREASAPRTLLCLTLCSKRLGTISKSSASKATEKRAENGLLQSWWRSLRLGEFSNPRRLRKRLLKCSIGGRELTRVFSLLISPRSLAPWMPPFCEVVPDALPTPLVVSPNLFQIFFGGADEPVSQTQQSNQCSPSRFLLRFSNSSCSGAFSESNRSRWTTVPPAKKLYFSDHVLNVSSRMDAVVFGSPSSQFFDLTPSCFDASVARNTRSLNEHDHLRINTCLNNC